MRRKTLIRAAFSAAAALIILAAGIIIIRNMDRDQYTDNRDQMTEGFGQLKTLEWNDAVYREKPAVTTILIAGIDRTEEPEPRGVWKYRSGGQADFLLLIAIDHSGKKIHQLQIDRNTITDVAVLGVFGNETGTRKLQICLAHSFGETPQDNAKYTIRAVQNLLEGIEIDGYYMVNYTAVPIINDALGGVTVTIPDDMTNENPSWIPGTNVTLHGEEAETFVRARKSVAGGTNKERMVRQNEYMRNAILIMNKKISKDIGFGENLLKNIQNLSVSNMTIKRLAEELNKAYDYEILEVEYPEGEYIFNPSTNYIEFHMREDAAVEWILRHLYTKQ